MDRLLTIEHFVYLHHRRGFGVTYLPRFFSLSRNAPPGSLQRRRDINPASISFVQHSRIDSHFFTAVR